MRAIEVTHPGGPEVLRLIDAPLPVPRADEVRVRLHAIGVNYADVLCRRGAHPSMRQPPIIVGCEGAGEVVACGPDVTQHRVGERVGVYSPFGGAYADELVVPERYALPLPAAMAWDEAAAFTHVYLTAWHALRTQGRATPGDWLFVSAAAGGLGGAVRQLADAFGLQIIAGVGSDAKADALRAAGCAHVVNYEREDLRARLADITGGRGVDIAIETVGGRVFAAVQQALAPLARLVTVGVAGGDGPQPDVGTLLAQSASYATLNLSVIFARCAALIAPSWQALLALYARGALRPQIGHRYALAQAADAQALMESRRSTGKIVLTP
ncbi:quinone oxidoreductase family protein [Solimonas marina]|uniref:Zinc-binding dehydrogenase n=1 Tax=Solimonas marina TaxID=2714601 RepID=A0A969WBX5_9GAMM|nr:zinc-binding dehydrogenase [Solimonas marina]NKF22621.1 zinc-binding dehydrogenase [Solimonas marina]